MSEEELVISTLRAVNYMSLSIFVYGIVLWVFARIGRLEIVRNSVGSAIAVQIVAIVLCLFLTGITLYYSIELVRVPAVFQGGEISFYDSLLTIAILLIQLGTILGVRSIFTKAVKGVR